MEEQRRTTRSRRVRFSERQTRRQQRYAQAGGADPSGMFIAKVPHTEMPSNFPARLASALRAGSSPFGFLTRERWWEERDTAAENYTIIISRQEELFDIGLAAIRDILGLTPDSTDAEIIDKLKHGGATSDDDVKSCIHILLMLERVITVGSKNASCGTANQTKTQALFKAYTDMYGSGRSTLLHNRYSLAYILLNPLTFHNMAVASLVQIFKTLKADPDTLSKLRSADVPTKTLTTFLLRDKYVSFMYAYAREHTNATLRDNFYYDGCALAEGSGYDTFITYFLAAISESKTNIEPPKTSFAAAVKGIITPTPAQTAETFGELAGILFNKFMEADATRTSLISHFKQEGAVAPAAPYPELEGYRTTRGTAAQTINDLTGMLPVSYWQQPIFTGGPTFAELLSKLDPPHIHFLLHFTELLFRP
jgi:hypothetical protein